MDYQKTLNLPKTEFSMRAGLATKEPAYLKRWEESELYQKIRAKSKDKDAFILHDGPPYANGDIHMGHTLNKILKDLIVKMRTMQGKDALYIPGWDCHGLPIEHKLMSEMKKRKSDVNVVDFRRQAHDYAMKYVGIQREQFKRLGIFGDWDHPYLTLDAQYEHVILKALALLNEKGFIYRGLKPVNWDIDNETALAEAEIEYDDVTSPAIFVKFEIINTADAGLPGDKPAYLVIWTTTPWTLVANVAVAAHEAFDYDVISTGREYLIMEQSLTPAILEKAGLKREGKGRTIKGKDLTAVKYRHPLDMRTDCPVVCADYVTKEDGTGLVHTAPGHGQDDFETGRKYNLDVVMLVNDKGHYTEGAKKYTGMQVFAANPVIIEDLAKKDLLLQEDTIRHSYPHSWRSKKPIIFRATHQWFLKIDHDNLRGKLREAIRHDVKWIPPSGEERIKAMVTGRPDWCLSRQRHWGVPIPALIPKTDDPREAPRLYSEVIERFAEVVKEEGTDAWFKRDVKDFLPDGFKCPETGATEFTKTFDILDVWFDSGVSHRAVIKDRLGGTIPVAMYLEGSDQHRGWFQSSLIPAVALEGKAPFSSVLTHGFVVDGEGRKMSKSVGNVISPHDLIKQSGADILRLWVCSCNYEEDIRLSKEITDRVIDAYRKIRNTVRYLLGNLNGFDPDRDSVAYDKLEDIDKWALSRLHVASQTIRRNFNHYEFSDAFKWIYSFCNEDLSGFYLDILKDRLYASSANAPVRRAAQTVLYHILDHLVRLIAPVLSFTAEEIFDAMPKTVELKTVESVHLLDWWEVPDEWHNLEVEDKLKGLINLRLFVLKALEDKRAAGEIGSSLAAKVIFETASKKLEEYISGFGDFLSEALIVSQAEVRYDDTVKTGLGTEFPQTRIRVEKAEGQKCARCWVYKVDVGQNKEHPEICQRCVEAVAETARTS